MRILITIVPIAIVALLLSFGFQQLIGFWETFTVSSAAMLLAVYWKRATDISYGHEIIQELTVDMDHFFQRATQEVQCPCKAKINMPLFVGEEVEVLCEECHNKFIVTSSIETRLITDPRSSEAVYDQLKAKMAVGTE